jgi:hypothetical protein
LEEAEKSEKVKNDHFGSFFRFWRFKGQKDYFWVQKGRKGLKRVKTIAHLVLKLVWGVLEGKSLEILRGEKKSFFRVWFRGATFEVLEVFGSLEVLKSRTRWLQRLIFSRCCNFDRFLSG